MNMDADEKIDVLSDAELLTQRQAEAWVIRKEEGMSRQAAADELGIAPGTLDDYVAAAEEKISSARKTVAWLDLFQE